MIVKLKAKRKQQKRRKPSATSQQSSKSFSAAVLRGREFESRERQDWLTLPEGKATFEAATEWMGKRGRVDIRIDDLGDIVAVVELKATDWNRILPHRIRPTALRHARQVWRYIEREVDEGRDTSPGLIYQRAPRDADTKLLVEEVLAEQLIQVVWRD